MKARAVIDANFGDSGKGLMTDYLCAKQGAGVVVRFNGGANAGHTVVTPDGQRHVFGHFGSGTFVGVPTFLSEFYVCNPILFFKERAMLHARGINPTVYAHPSCKVTTFADMILNQRLENARGENRFGSCGVGLNETMQRSLIRSLDLTVGDLWNKINRLPSILEEICGKYATFRSGKPIVEPEMCTRFIEGCWKFAEAVHPAGIAQCVDPVFEGAQGLLLDQNNKEFFPNVTHSNTGMKNVRKLCAMAGITEIDTYYVSRTYLTRHGAGKLPGEDPRLRYEDNTNVPHPYQGEMRFAPLDYKALQKRCREDYGSEDYWLVQTHCDQLPASGFADLYSYGPTRDCIHGKPI